MHDSILHEGFDYFDEKGLYDEPVYEDIQLVRVGDTKVDEENHVLFWTGQSWEPVKLPSGDYFTVDSEEEARLIELAKSDPIEALMQAAELDLEGISRRDMVAMIVQLELENELLLSDNEKLQDELEDYKNLGLTPNEILSLLDNHEELQTSVNLLRNDLDETVDLLEDYYDDRDDYHFLMSELFTDEKCASMEDRGWVVVGMDQRTSQDLPNLPEGCMFIEDGEYRFLYTPED